MRFSGKVGNGSLNKQGHWTNS